MATLNITSIPVLNDTTVKVFFNNKFIGDASSEQLNKIRIQIVEHIIKTNDLSVLESFYVIGHKDGQEIGEEIKITMDESGNLSDIPWELSHVRRDMLHLMKLDMAKNNN